VQKEQEGMREKKQRLLVMTYDWLKMNLLMNAYIPVK
jgi:hypothetical protein